jgi:hypothetical protein
VRIAYGATGIGGTYHFSEPFVGEADFPLPGDVAYKTTGYYPPLYVQNQRFFPQTDVAIERRNPELKMTTISGHVLDFRGRPLARATVATDEPLFVTVTDGRGDYLMMVPTGEDVRVRAFALGEVPAVSKRIHTQTGEPLRVELQTAAPPAPAELVNGHFDKCHETEAGLIEGWTGFGTTDGALASGHERILFKKTSHAGEGLYFAQSGSNTKNGGSYQLVQATPGQRYRLSGWVYTYTFGEAKKPMDNNCRLGIDPTGGRDPDSSDVVWTDATESESKWTQIAVEATATHERITIYLRHEMRRGNIWNITLFDTIDLKKVEEKKD